MGHWIIEVEIDYKNLSNVQLYEDITNKITSKIETDGLWYKERE